MTTFNQLLEQFDNAAKTTAAKGRRFERFCQTFLQVDPFWSTQFAEVWTWDEWPGRDGRVDTGIDLVARKAGSDDLVAIQCKFYSPSATLSWTNVSTFAGMLGSPEFSEGLLISTAGRVSEHVTNNLDSNEKTTRIWGVEDFEQSRVDWSQFSIKNPTSLVLGPQKTLRPHQVAAIEDVIGGFTEHDRGQLIMACGTGKTLTSLRLAEQTVGLGGTVLFLVPSINLLSQTVLAWANDAEVPLVTFAVCSDTQAGRRKSDEDMSYNDLSFPATTDVQQLGAALEERARPDKLTVIFSTYQSIDVIIRAQEQGLAEFDLVICDEAHRTTGAFRAEDDQSVFTKVHDAKLLSARKRLYMTATPRIYGDQTKSKAQDNDVILASMDDEDTFGPEFHHLSFGEAVGKKLLSDYKVIVLAVNEESLPAAFQKHFTDSAGELALGDVARIVGCWHGLSKRGPQFKGDSIPMRRAVAFSSTIKQSKAFTQAFPVLVNAALADRADPNAVRVETDHVDGTTNVKVRSAAIRWLQDSPGQRTARVLSNAKCLTEGVDVPALDAVLFLQPRKSIVDVVQAVGRVMRLSDGKDFGYVILPVGIPAGKPPEEALKDNERYKVVWQVLQALRSHDERLAAEINKIDINGTSERISVIGIGMAGGDQTDEPGVTISDGDSGATQVKLELPDLDEWRDALYARIVERVGDRKYLESWASEISTIAQSQEARIRALLDHPDQNRNVVNNFEKFLEALQHNLNDGVTREDAISMLSQHLITRPVFEALFGGHGAAWQNSVSQSMQAMMDELDAAGIQSEVKALDAFYDHIRMLIGGIETPEGRQQIVTRLYEEFFRKALPKESEALGIVYTPVEIVDFINRSTDSLLQQHFGGGRITDKGVHVLDPFTGTGTFIARLLQTGLIEASDIRRKYDSELHANELTLLAYYIAAINIETVFRGLTGAEDGEQTLFNGIVLADTFQLSEGSDNWASEYFPRNNARADRQKSLDIRVIVGNPPYSAGQTSQNDDNSNQKYPTLDASIERKYAARSTATNKNSLYDSYIRAFRWATNKLIESPNGGVIGFVTNGGWLDGVAASGMRKSLVEEFHHIYVINLRGNARTSGDLRRQEGDNVFAQGSRSTIAITFLVRRPEPVTDGGGVVHYLDIGDYLTREGKLECIAQSGFDSISWQQIQPNRHGDWINQRDDSFEKFIPLSGGNDALFLNTSMGLETGRDAWVYNSSEAQLQVNVERMVKFFNSQVEGFRAMPIDEHLTVSQRTDLAREWVDRDPRAFSWVRADFGRVASGAKYRFLKSSVRTAVYRPFFRQHVVLDSTLNNAASKLPSLFPTRATENLCIVTQKSGPAPFFAWPSVDVPDAVIGGAGNRVHVFARWVSADGSSQDSLFSEASEAQSNLNPLAVEKLGRAIGRTVSCDEAFAYCYAVLLSPAYCRAFESSLKKEGARIPVPANLHVFNELAAAGEELLKLHANFDEVEEWPLEQAWRSGVDDSEKASHLNLGRQKMALRPSFELGDDQTARYELVYNSSLTLRGIPADALSVMAGTRSFLDWIVDRWYVRTDRDSGIVNDPNEWIAEQGDPWYLVELVGKVVRSAVDTARILREMPNPLQGE